MSPSELANELRAVALAIEGSGVDESIRTSFEINIHGINTRPELAKWARLAEMAGDVEVDKSEHGSYLTVSHWRPKSRFWIHVHFKSGLLGGVVQTIHLDGKEGLAKLLAETNSLADAVGDSAPAMESDLTSTAVGG